MNFSDASNLGQLSLGELHVKVGAEAQVAFGDRIDKDDLQMLVDQAMEGFYSARVSTFVPLLAMRRIRESVDALELIQQ